MTETTLYPIEVIQGVEGLCIGLNNYRIVGPKPWGGGSVVKRWDVSVDDLKRAIPELATIDALTTENATLKAEIEGPTGTSAIGGTGRCGGRMTWIDVISGVLIGGLLVCALLPGRRR